MKFITLSMLMMISINAFGNELCAEEAEGSGGGGSAAEIVKFVEGQECPNKAKLKNICMNIGLRTKSKITSIKYEYQRKFLEAACVDTGKDSPEVIQNKIKVAWSKFETELKCSSVSFDVTDGNIIKYAVTTEFEEFVDDAIKWKVNLNKIDDSDGRTVLDYVQYHIQKNKGNELQERFQYYYLKLKQAGAKHKTEL